MNLFYNLLWIMGHGNRNQPVNKRLNKRRQMRLSKSTTMSNTSLVYWEIFISWHIYLVISFANRDKHNTFFGDEIQYIYDFDIICNHFYFRALCSACLKLIFYRSMRRWINSSELKPWCTDLHMPDKKWRPGILLK